ncbi:SUF system Fe-S cluster assembly regulator [Thauera phenylacetica]|jgi:FeS assembly SUF system regulator|uniref:BadM/Rrf2 family transcriptional regulator n=1 Tax=Thauera phenylacetica B4P TaxID=1234382 RepID=N6ZN82_9RHOO|nr:SUF system Fe-S cluster assembly regulator [Thauera phenylacetica]ENO95982.1 BadM/Rrf2 family transcriptional regulator [Thauera phenylacetica B4P]
MLRISKLTDYGTLILTHMAGHPGRVHSAAGLAEALGLGLPTVSKVLKTLGRHELVSSQRGAHGGYALARPPNRITVADVIDALEEQAFGLTECSSSSGVCAIESDCRIRENWMRINTVVRQALQAVNIADMVHPGHGAAFPAPHPTEHRMHGPARSAAACLPGARTDEQEI